jgi:hypothetical protein
VHAVAAPQDFPFVFMEELALVFPILAPLGMLAFLRRPGARLAGLVLLVSWAGSLGAALYGGFDPANPDVRGYLGPAIALTALFSGGAIAAGFVALARWLPAWLAPSFAGALAVVALVRFPTGDHYPGLRHATTADALATQLLASAPPRSALLTGYHETAFLVGYQRAVEGRRPDVAWAHLGFVEQPGATERLATAQPDLGPILRAHPSLQQATALDRRRPVRFESGAHVASDLRAQLVADGPLWRLKTAAPHRLAPSISLDEAAEDPQVRGYLGWRAFNDAAFGCASGDDEAAGQSFATLRQLYPQDRFALALAADCAALSNNPRFLRGAP